MRLQFLVSQSNVLTLKQTLEDLPPLVIFDSPLLTTVLYPCRFNSFIIPKPKTPSVHAWCKTWMRMSPEKISVSPVTRFVVANTHPHLPANEAWHRVPKAIGGARNALHSFAQICIVHKIGNQGIVGVFAGLPVTLVKTLSSSSAALDIARMRSR